VEFVETHIAAVFERAGMLAPSPDDLALLDAACAGVEGGYDAVLEVSRATWATERAREAVLVVLVREAVILVAMRKGGLFRGSQPEARRESLADYSAVAEDDEVLGSSVFFLAPAEDDHFLLSWADRRERRRMFTAIFAAHAGRYEQWGMQLDPAEYGADFDRFYAEIAAEGPDDGSDLFGWVEGRFGEFDISNALGLALDWRGCVLDDQAGREPSRRVGRLSFPHPWIDSGPEARRVFVRLGEELFDAGLLGPPYDERTFDLGEEPITNRDAGPARLLALMTLAAHAKGLGNPRWQEWAEAARAGVPLLPPKVFPENLRDLWSGIEDLPAIDSSPPSEIPIQDDVDVRAISSREGDRVVYSQDGLSEADDALIKSFFVADGKLGDGGPPDGDAVMAVCLLGVKVFEGLSITAPAGWRKLVLYAVSDLTYDLWDKHQVVDAAKLAHWVVVTIEANGWGPDGRSTALGQHHSYAMGVAVETGVGVVQIDPQTGRASAPTGDEARRAAAVGHF
jgi:hypothetical protein